MVALYIHIPWCIRKCPYCDFNSHQSPQELPEKQYINALLEDLKYDIARFPNTLSLQSIFLGGGTPSLFSADAYHLLFTELKRFFSYSKNIEITLEANPGTVEQQRFSDYRQIGINRLSLGIQSFNAKHLKVLGRIHDANQAHRAVESARLAGFDNINLDLMHGLPGQTAHQGLEDLNTALNYKPEHLSWYQLTIEPNTVFYKQRPKLPQEETLFNLENEGLALLGSSGFKRYEISAFCRNDLFSQHNLNYWLFGDYYGIGAGAHGKLTQQNSVFRTQKYRLPKDYLNGDKPYQSSVEQIDVKNLIFEFMLNTTRLEQIIPKALFTQKTGLEFSLLAPLLQIAQEKGLIHVSASHWQITELGRRFTNDLQALFLP